MKPHIISGLLLIGILFSGAYTYAQLPTQSSSPLYIYLIRGIGRETGHWGTELEGKIFQQYPHAQLVFMDLPGSGVFLRPKGTEKYT